PRPPAGAPARPAPHARVPPARDPAFLRDLQGTRTGQERRRSRLGGARGGRGRDRGVPATVEAGGCVNPRAAVLRLRGGAHNTTAGGSRADNRRRPGDPSPRSGLWRAGSASRQTRRPSRRTGTSKARPTVARVPDTVDTS